MNRSSARTSKSGFELAASGQTTDLVAQHTTLTPEQVQELTKHLKNENVKIIAGSEF